MKKIYTFLVLICLCVASSAQEHNPLMTEWGEKVEPGNVLPEYPRPQLERADWLNLNGCWEYAIVARGAAEPEKFAGNILVPYPVESALSGVEKTVSQDRELWYRRTVTLPKSWKNKDVLLHFGAVDWRADVYVNDILIGSHEGGYAPFSFNITPFLTAGEQKIAVKVWDPTSDGPQPRGKQVKNPGGIFYTAVTGIWQTVWLEPVSHKHISGINAVPDIDNKVLNVTVNGENLCSGDIFKVEILDKGQVVASGKGVDGGEIRLKVNEPKLWSPSSPYLYDLRITLSSAGKTVDEAKSYSAFRKISMAMDEKGFMRMQLNNRNLFHLGTLDQGWWPDGLYTAPTDEALAFDIEKTKALGFNMIRKHVKVEPARWYYHCDRLGMLVWQDMPGGDRGGRWDPGKIGGGEDTPRTEASKAIYKKELKEVMDLCRFFPSVVVWVPFNESWGQFETEGIAEWVKSYDGSRLVNPASGGNFRNCGDILDWHNYPAPKIKFLDIRKVNVLGEYGGIGLVVNGHTWLEKKSWGYIKINSIEEVTGTYVKFGKSLKDMVQSGLSGSVYTQFTDVEAETNGIYTYDRKVLKMKADEVKAINTAIIDSLSD